MLNPKHRHGRPELFSARGSKAVIAVGAKMGQFCRDHLALLAEGAREQVDVVPPCGIRSHGDPCRQRLVVGVGVDEQQPCLSGGALGRRRSGHRTARSTVARSTVLASAGLST
jgi:hypothetical protein